MPANYYGPLLPGQNRRQLGQRMRRANAAYYAARAAHNYARENDVYGRAYRVAAKKSPRMVAQAKSW